MTPFFTIQKFEELSPAELYAILQLRNEVFVVEQNCVFQDADDRDQSSYHLCLWENGQLAAYCRLLPSGIAYDEYASIGRVVSAPRLRGSGYGIQLMKEAIRLIEQLFPGSKVKISAQCYLQEFYISLGFSCCTEPYIEDNLPHIGMILQK